LKHGFYFRFHKIIKSEFVCCILANMAYFLYMVKFFINKIRQKQSITDMTCAEAREIIDKIYPKPMSKPVCINPEINNDLDLSIVIPVYNYASILENNIHSVLNQKTKYNYEVIFVDDGSTDGAQDILRKYESNPKVKLIFQENGGIANARNTGINNASGKYIMFVDCDDTVHDNIVELLLSKAYADGCDMVVAAHNLAKEKDGQVFSNIPNVYPDYNLMGFRIMIRL